MSCHRIHELIELLPPEWQNQGYLNIKNEAPDALMAGIAKDVKVDFKSALLKARGLK